MIGFCPFLRMLPRVFVLTHAMRDVVLWAILIPLPSGTPAIPQVALRKRWLIPVDSRWSVSRLRPTVVFLSLLYVDNNFVTSSTDISRSCWYAAQESWIQARTISLNVLSSSSAFSRLIPIILREQSPFSLYFIRNFLPHFPVWLIILWLGLINRLNPHVRAEIPYGRYA